MIRSVKFLVFALGLFITLTSFCQTVKVRKETARIKGVNVEGYVVDLEGNADDVNAAFIKYLKAAGKVKQGNDYVMLTESTLNGKSYFLPVYGTTRGAQAWLGVITSEWTGGDADDVSKQFEKVLYDFGVQFYRDKIQVQIDESNRALQAVERQQQRFSNQNRDLNTKLEDNKREKIQLEKAIVTNQQEYETLLKKIEKNKKDQDSLSVSNEQIKKVIEAQKLKQSKVN